jgi:hypothetical protein
VNDLISKASGRAATTERQLGAWVAQMVTRVALRKDIARMATNLAHCGSLHEDGSLAWTFFFSFFSLRRQV